MQHSIPNTTHKKVDSIAVESSFFVELKNILDTIFTFVPAHI